MVGGFGLLIIFVMLFRHFGAVIRENHIETVSKKDAINNGYDTYLSAKGGEKLVSNDHSSHTYLDPNKGSYVHDFVTNENHYTGWDRMLQECDKDTANGCTPSFWCPDKSVYDNPIGTKRSYIDRKTHQVLYLYQAPWQSDKAHKQIKHECFYFADENGNPIRKTQGQDLIDKRAEENGCGYLNWSIEEIKRLPKGHIDGAHEVMWQKTDNMFYRQMWREAGLI